MALFDEQLNKVDGIAETRINQLSAMLDDKIAQIRELLNGITFSVNAKDIKPAAPVEK
jgi:hypothetical protein